MVQADLSAWAGTPRALSRCPKESWKAWTPDCVYWPGGWSIPPALSAPVESDACGTAMLAASHALAGRRAAVWWERSPVRAGQPLGPPQSATGTAGS